MGRGCPTPSPPHCGRGLERVTGGLCGAPPRKFRVFHSKWFIFVQIPLFGYLLLGAGQLLLTAERVPSNQSNSLATCLSIVGGLECLAIKYASFAITIDISELLLNRTSTRTERGTVITAISSNQSNQISLIQYDKRIHINEYNK